MNSELTSSAVDLGFEPRSTNQTKYYKIGIIHRFMLSVGLVNRHG
jgi:hypothetical protein